MSRLFTRLIPALLLIILLAACGGTDDASPEATALPAEDATAVPTPTPTEIMERAGDVMNELQSASFEMTRNGGPAYIDADQSLNFSAAVGVFSAPAAIEAEFTVLASGAAIQLDTIAIDDEQWLTNPVNQQWEKLPPDFGFNPAIIFDAEQGWKPLLQQDISDVELLEVSTFGGVTRYRIRAMATGERVKTITGGAAGDEAVEIIALIDPETFHIVQLEFTTISSTGEPADWLLKFSEFNVPVTINPPQ